MMSVFFCKLSKCGIGLCVFSVDKCRAIDNYANSDQQKFLNIDLINAHRLV